MKPVYGLKKWIADISDWPSAKPPHLHVVLFPDDPGPHIIAEVKTPEQKYDRLRPRTRTSAVTRAKKQAEEIAQRCGWEIDWQEE